MNTNAKELLSFCLLIFSLANSKVWSYHLKGSKSAFLEENNDPTDNELITDLPDGKVTIMSVIGDDMAALDWTSTSDEELTRLFDDHDFEADTELVKKGSIEDIQFYWQMPTTNAWVPQGILFLAHECHGHSAMDWFPSLSQSAPEEQAIVAEARKLGMMIVAMDADRYCWEYHDGSRIAKVLQHLAKRLPNVLFSQEKEDESSMEHLLRFPLYAFGSAAGAPILNDAVPMAFQALADEDEDESKPIALDGIIVQNAGRKIVQPHDDFATVFITQSGEEEIREDIEKSWWWEPEEYDLVTHIKLSPVFMTPDLLSDRIEQVNMELSEGLYSMIQEAGLLDMDNNGSLKSNPKYDRTMQELLDEFRKINLRNQDPIADNSLMDSIEQVLMVVWGQHSVTRDGVRDAIETLQLRAARLNILLASTTRFGGSSQEDTLSQTKRDWKWLF